jgi:hypothetical protein
LAYTRTQLAGHSVAVTAPFAPGDDGAISLERGEGEASGEDLAYPFRGRDSPPRTSSLVKP